MYIRRKTVASSPNKTMNIKLFDNINDIVKGIDRFRVQISLDIPVNVFVSCIDGIYIASDNGYISNYISSIRKERVNGAFTFREKLLYKIMERCDLYIENDKCMAVNQNPSLAVWAIVRAIMLVRGAKMTTEIY